MMKITKVMLPIALVALMSGGVAGCAKSSDMDQLRMDITSAKDAAMAAEKSAAMAAAEAKRAADMAAASEAAAKAASEKADRIFSQGLRK